MQKAKIRLYIVLTHLDPDNEEIRSKLNHIFQNENNWVCYMKNN